MLGSLKGWIVEHLPRRFVIPLTRACAFGINKFSLDDQAYGVFSEEGFELLRRHFYLPIPEQSDLTEFWKKPTDLVGVDMNDGQALELLEEVFTSYMSEFRNAFTLHPVNGSSQFYLINGSFMAIDAHVYYAMIRHFRPRRIIEIGAGNSTLVAGEACQRNREDSGEAPDLTAIDPYPSANLKQGVPGLSRLLESRIQDIDLSTFTSLESGDILFIDSTHVLREGGDVQLEYCEILPRLKPGVIVHIHDISLPKPYPKVYFERHLYWNEQSVLQAFLTFNTRFEVLWPGNYMLMHHAEKVRRVFPEFEEMRKAFPSSEPSSFWIRVKPLTQGV